MKVGIRTLVVVAAMATLTAIGGVTPALAQSPNFTNFTGATNLSLNGNAAVSGAVLRLTPATTGQAGSAWFNTAQVVTGGFSTTFTFNLSGANTNLCGTPVPCPADGIAFVIQNSSATALGPVGCGIGFGGGGCAGDATGITNSLAVEFDTFNNGANDGDTANHVAIQSCPGMGANTTDITSNCNLANFPLPGTLADGANHTVTISYVGASHKLSVILDNKDLFPGGVTFNLADLGLSGTNLNSALVGFTAATGGADDNQDILSWKFTPTAESAVVTAGGGTATIPFQNNAFDYNASLDANAQNPAATTVQIKPILIDVAACEKLVQKSFPFTQCFVYQNAAGSGHDSAVLFELTCPGFNAAGTCGDTSQKFFAELGTDFTFTKAENPGFKFPGTFAILNPFPGWLKGDGGVPGSPCTPPATGALFQSNQIDSFAAIGDPAGVTKGKSGGGGSCWVATYFTWGELPPGISITRPAFTTYTQNQVVSALYSCTNPASSKPLTNAKGPYLTAASCTQSQAPNNITANSCSTTSNGLTCTGAVDTSVLGLHVFQVTALDSGGNANVNVVIYNVKKAGH